ncbi:unnamed protein product [Gadus morhua 'NCC']
MWSCHGLQEDSSLSLTSENLNQNLNQNINQNLTQNLNQNLNQKLTQNLNQNLNQNLSQNLNQNLNQNLTQNLNQNLNQNLTQNLNQNLTQDLNQNLNQNLTQDLNQNLNQNLRISRTLKTSAPSHSQPRGLLCSLKPLDGWTSQGPSRTSQGPGLDQPGARRGRGTYAVCQPPGPSPQPAPTGPSAPEHAGNRAIPPPDRSGQTLS